MVKVSTKFDQTVALTVAKHATRKIKWVICITISILFGISAVVGALKSNDIIDKIIYPVIFGALIIGTWLYFPRSIVKSSAKITATHRLLGASTICYYTLDDDRLIVEYIRDDEIISCDRLKYSDIFKVEETPDFYFIYIAQNLMYVMNKKTIENDEDYAEVSRLLRKAAVYKVCKK